MTRFFWSMGEPSRAEVFANRTAECTTTLPMRYPGWSGGNDRIMDADFKTYLRAAQGEEAPIGAGEPRWAETEALARKLIAGGQAEPALKALKLEPQARKRWDLLLLAGLLNDALGERGASLEAFEVVGDKLAAAEDREGVRTLLPRFLEPAPVSAAVRLLHFLARHSVTDEERMGLLRQALEIRPNDPHFLSELSQILERGGEPDEARGMRLRAIELWLELNHPEAVSDELLRVVEEDLPREPARVGRILLRYAAAVSWEDSEAILDLALPELTRRGAGLWSWRELEPVGARAPQTIEARKLLATLLRIAVASEPDPDAIVAGSGIQNHTEPFAGVRARVPKILSLPPGADVVHATWGLGRVAANDGESVSLEFPGRAGHKMSLAMAARSLDRLPPDGIRVLAAREPERMRELIRTRDPQIVVSALRDLGGTATQVQMKPRIEAVLPPAEWSAWRQEETFLWRAIESRLPRLRESGRSRLRALLGPAFGKAVSNQLQHAAESPALAARLIEHYASNPGEEEAPPPPALLMSTLRLLERDGAGVPGVSERLLELLGPDGALRRLVLERPLDPETAESLERTVLHWRGSERRHQPVLEFLRNAGHTQGAERSEARRSATAQTLLEGKSIEDLETRHTIMSRPTYERLEAEFKKLKLDLKTVIPAAIEKARQLGDLRENAEYEAAKQRQANAAARAQELMNLLDRTRLLETIEVDPSRVGVGTEVSLEPLDPAGAPITYWILGEGDHALGPGILSYRAPILKPLLGKPEGTQVMLELPEGERPYCIASIRKRLPEETA